MVSKRVSDLRVQGKFITIKASKAHTHTLNRQKKQSFLRVPL